MNENKTYKNPIEEQRKEALKHYEEVSSQCHHWSSFVEAAIKAYNPPVSEPVPEKIEVMNFVGRKKYTDERCTDTIYEFNSTRQIPLDRFPAIKQAIESCLNEPLPQPPSALNDTVVEDRFDGKRASFYAMDEVGQWAAADKELTKEKIDELMKEFHNQPLQFYSPPKRYSQSEVDAIRADTWYAARKITDKVVGEIDFKDGDRCPFYEKYFNSINDYLSSLNLNSNDTGKELFTTLDGVKIFRGDTYFPVDDNFNILFTTNAQQEYKDAGWLRAFSTYDAAQYWVSENKPKPEQPTNDNAFVLNDEEVKELARRYYGNLKIGAFFGENATEINEDIERRVFDFYVGYKTANGEKIPNKVFQPLNYLQSKQSAPEPSALPTKEWEIVSFVSIHGEVLTLDEKKWKYRSETSSISDMDFLLKHYSIHSVRRLSDNTVFVAQTINNGKTIEKFYNGWNGMEIHYTDGSASLLLEETFLPPPTPTQPVVEQLTKVDMPETKYMNTVEAYNEGFTMGVRHCEKYGIPSHKKST